MKDGTSIQKLNLNRKKLKMNDKTIAFSIAAAFLMTGCITSFDGTIVPASSSTLQNEMTEGVYTA